MKCNGFLELRMKYIRWQIFLINKRDMEMLYNSGFNLEMQIEIKLDFCNSIKWSNEKWISIPVFFGKW